MTDAWHWRHEIPADATFLGRGLGFAIDIRCICCQGSSYRIRKGRQVHQDSFHYQIGGAPSLGMPRNQNGHITKENAKPDQECMGLKGPDSWLAESIRHGVFQCLFLRGEVSGNINSDSGAQERASRASSYAGE